MGEVYKATDANLKRSVAIKVLPASVAADVERLARFQREAEVLASMLEILNLGLCDRAFDAGTAGGGKSGGYSIIAPFTMNQARR